MKTIYSASLALCVIILGAAYQITPTSASFTVPPASTPVDSLPAGCSCGAVCRCAELEAEIDRLRDALEVARARRVVIPASVPVVKQVAVSDCPGGVCGVSSQPAAATRRVIVQRPQRSGWYPGKNLRGRR